MIMIWGVEAKKDAFLTFSTKLSGTEEVRL